MTKKHKNNTFSTEEIKKQDKYWADLQREAMKPVLEKHRKIISQLREVCNLLKKFLDEDDKNGNS